MARFHSLKVKDIKRETADSVSVAFDVPAMQQPEYLFKQGQYITLKLTINGEELRRSYSLCTSPYSEKELRIAVKEVNNGKASTYINRQLKVGDVVEVMTPLGNFYTSLSGGNKKNYVLFAGGSGITPIISILKSILYIEKESHVTLFYANKNESSTIFKSEIDAIASNTTNLKVVYIFDEPTQKTNDLQTGIVSVEKTMALIENYGSVNADVYFICGPGGMMECVKTGLQKLKINDSKIKIEYFNATTDSVDKADGISDTAVNVKAKIKVIQYGFETDFVLETSGISILEACIEAGVDAPFSCKGAVCCTCRAKVLQGNVKMTSNFALTEQEVADGYILTCQSHPLTETVVVDYDAI
jgi:ring-1,2-phenylacetyl-CoA epoxidase subunit PaaE